jgi:RNA polymerase sigma factor (sigma-70 family)
MPTFANHELIDRGLDAARCAAGRHARRLGLGGADDLFSDLSLRVVNAARSYAGDLEGWHAYLGAALRNATSAFYRRRSRHGIRYAPAAVPVASLNSAGPDGEDSIDVPDRAGRTTWTESEWNRVLTPVAPEQRPVLILKYRKGKTMEEAARVLGLSLNRARQLHDAGLDVLRQTLSAGEGECQ